MKRVTKLVAAALAALLLLAIAACGNGVSFEGKALKTGKVGEEYADTVATGAEGVYYELDYEDQLPKGLVLAEDGSITGIPEEAGTVSFTVFMTDEESGDYRQADFSVTIEKGELIYTASALPDAETGEPYLQSVATATGAPEIGYALKEGSSLPAGLALSEAGEISGTPEAVSDGVAFTVVASAEGCDPVEAQFTIKVVEGDSGPTDLGYIVFEGMTLPDGEVGTAYNESIRTAYGVPGITYKIKYVGGIGLPKGLSYNSLGFIVGTPQNSTVGELRFNVVASADGYESVTAEFRLRVYDVYQQTNQFEAEYIVVDNLVGAGYSGSASGLRMLQSTFVNASNGWILGYLNKGVSFDFVIEAKQATSAALVLGVGSEWGTLNMTNSKFKIFVNGTELDYGSFTIEGAGSDASAQKFQKIEISPEVQLVAGENTITFEVIDLGTSFGGGTATAQGPLFDFIRLEGASGEIGWRPRVANIA